MYLISLYFDETSDTKIRSYMKQIARHTGNTAMLDGNVPPHITVAAFGTDSEEAAIELFEKIAPELCKGEIRWVSVGTFLPKVLYISPVLNEYLHNLSETIYKEIKYNDNLEPKGNYGPYGWVAHATLAKHLDTEQMRMAFKVMQNQFAPFESKVVKCGLAKTNPYKDLSVYDMK